MKAKKQIIWPIRYIPLSDEEIGHHAELCVIAYYGGYCGLPAAILKQLTRGRKNEKTGLQIMSPEKSD